MKLEIELDLNKIDYDEINKQIVEKIAALDIEETYDIKSKIESSISNYVNNSIDLAYNEYIDSYWKDKTKEGKNLVESISKAEIERRTRQVIEDIFANDYSEDVLREAMLKIIPDVFTAVIFERMESTLYNKEYNYQQEIHHMIRGEVSSMIGRY